MKKLLLTLEFDITDEQAIKFNNRQPSTINLNTDEDDAKITFSDGRNDISLTSAGNRPSVGIIDPDKHRQIIVDLAAWNNLHESAARYQTILSLTRQRRPFYKP